MKKALTIVVISSLILQSCKVDPKVKEVLPSDDLKEIIPAGWPTPVYRFENNAINEKVFVLGRALFYDPILSKDNTISCGTCHQQYAAFANADHPVSHGINDLVGNRNAPALFNMTWHKGFMHDGGINHIEVQPIGPIENPIEMDLKFADALNKLRGNAKYVAMFKDAFGTEEITDARFLKAMTQFQGLLYSYNSKFDLWKRGEGDVHLSEAELRGYDLFKQKCNTCHTEPLFSDFSYRSNGLTPHTFYKDSGRYRITQLPSDIYKFKVPSLRNITLTYPYMHDGRYTSLQQCLDHYTNNVLNPTNLDPLLQPNGIAMTSQEKSDIIEFLKTLTDYQFINDKRFADPGQ